MALITIHIINSIIVDWFKIFIGIILFKRIYNNKFEIEDATKLEIAEIIIP
nr:hypothetical protein [Staphylococcus equorum]